MNLAFDLAGVSASRLWSAFTDPDELIRWWPSSADIDLRLDGDYSLSWPAQWTLRGRYLRLDPPELLEFTWSWDHEDLPERLVRIEFSDGRIEIAHECGSEAECQGYVEGWTHFVGRLQDLLA